MLLTVLVREKVKLWSAGLHWEICVSPDSGVVDGVINIRFVGAGNLADSFRTQMAIRSIIVIHGTHSTAIARRGR
jgi:hypothetical protein